MLKNKQGFQPMGNDRTLNFCQTTDTSNLLTGSTLVLR